MFFIIDNNSKYNIELMKSSLNMTARKIILALPLVIDDVQMNNYLMTNYKLNLRQACLLILNDAQFSANPNNEIIITFKTKKYNDLASLITYGNSELQGSKILKKAFHY